MGLAILVFAGLFNLGAPIALFWALCNGIGYAFTSRKSNKTSQDFEDMEETSKIALGCLVFAVIAILILVAGRLWGSEELQPFIFIIPPYGN